MPNERWHDSQAQSNLHSSSNSSRTIMTGNCTIPTPERLVERYNRFEFDRGIPEQLEKRVTPRSVERTCRGRSLVCLAAQFTQHRNSSVGHRDTRILPFDHDGGVRVKGGDRGVLYDSDPATPRPPHHQAMEPTTNRTKSWAVSRAGLLRVASQKTRRRSFWVSGRTIAMWRCALRLRP